MAWFYYVRQGALLRADGVLVAICHSGHGDAMNEPARQAERSVGPIPVGRYTIGPAHTHPTCGPVAMRLPPQPGTETFGRSGFLIHGANRTPDPTDDSEGCIIADRWVREAVAASTDRDLEVVAEWPASRPLDPLYVEAEPVGPARG